MSHAGWAASLGHLGLQGAGQIQVPPDGIVVGASTECHKEMPDGMGKGDPPITLEEHHAQAVEDPSGHQLPDALSLTSVGGAGGEETGVGMGSFLILYWASPTSTDLYTPQSPPCAPASVPIAAV